MNKKTMIIVAVILIVGIVVGYLMAGFNKADENKKGAVVESRVPLYYRNPMNPEVTSPTPTKDPMGMDYVPVYLDNKSLDKQQKNLVEIDPVVVQNMGVRTERAKKETITKVVRTVGHVDFAEDLVVNIHPKVDGWIESIQVNKTGEQVSADQVLLEIYSPKLVSTQQEYLLALGNLESLEKSPIEEIRQNAKTLVASSRKRLELLDVPEHQIQELEKTGMVKQQLHIHSPISGTVTSIGAREGQYITPNTELYKIVDLTQVWVYADVYDYELPWVKVGDKVEVELTSAPGQKFNGTVSYIYPYSDSKTRTTKIRALFQNVDFILKPDMFAQVEIHSNRIEDAVTIPSESIVRTGTASIVFISRGEGRFEPREVILGIESEGRISIVEGIDPGESVVTSSQFLLDSESKLQEATQKMLDAKVGGSNVSDDKSDRSNTNGSTQ